MADWAELSDEAFGHLVAAHACLDEAIDDLYSDGYHAHVDDDDDESADEYVLVAGVLGELKDVVEVCMDSLEGVNPD